MGAAAIETYVAELRRLARPEAIESDVRERLGEPATNHELFVLLERAGWVDHGQSELLRRMVGFRNVLVHGYTAVDPRIVRSVVTDHLGDLTGFVTAIRSHLSRKGA